MVWNTLPCDGIKYPPPFTFPFNKNINYLMKWHLNGILILVLFYGNQEFNTFICDQDSYLKFSLKINFLQQALFAQPVTNAQAA